MLENARTFAADFRPPKDFHDFGEIPADQRMHVGKRWHRDRVDLLQAKLRIDHIDAEWSLLDED